MTETSMASALHAPLWQTYGQLTDRVEYTGSWSLEPGCKSTSKKLEKYIRR